MTFKELQQKGAPVSIEEVRKNLQMRDTIDSTRADSPLKQATDAVVIDNTLLTPADQLDLALKLVDQRINNKFSLQ